jgi:hypothetical protein
MILTVIAEDSYCRISAALAMMLNRLRDNHIVNHWTMVIFLKPS